jgi:hypothetical protein
MSGGGENRQVIPEDFFATMSSQTGSGAMHIRKKSA